MKKFKMVLYGEPGVGKSVFASKAPKPFFITTDGNYEWLEDFGAKPEDHKQVSSWDEAKKLFASDFNGYETVVVDLLEDLFKWCEYEYCSKNRITHLSDHGYGKGYDITRNEFFIEICKLLALDKNVILIMHGQSYTTKDRRGVEHTKHAPSGRLPDKVLDMIEGRVRYFLRCYLKAEELEDGTLVKRRYLSLVPKENEFGIIRGINENSIPHDIPLEFKDFATCIGLSETVTHISEERAGTSDGEDKVKRRRKRIQTEEIETASEKTDISKEDTVEITERVAEEVKEEPKAEAKPEVKAEAKSEPKTEIKELSNEDKLAAIKAKLAAMKAGK